MTKTKTKLRVAAAMLAVLLLTCAWVGAVSATITYGYKLDGADDYEAADLWPARGDPAPEYQYWTADADTGQVIIPVALTTDDTGTYLRAYDFTTSIDQGLAADKYSPVAVLLTDGDVVNGGHIAAGSGMEGNALGQNTKTTFFNVEVDKGPLGLTAGTIYTVSFTNNGVVLSPISSNTGLTVDSVTADYTGTPSALKFLVRANPKITEADFLTYVDNMGLTGNTGTITLYREHNNGVVTAQLTVDPELDPAYDSITWFSENQANFLVGDNPTNDDKDNILTLQGRSSGTSQKVTSPLTVQLSSSGYTDDLKTITVSVENWWQGTTKNYDESGSSTEGANWNFDNELTYSVNLGGQPVITTSGDWDTGVTLADINTGITRTALTDYIATKIVGLKDEDAKWTIPAGYQLSKTDDGALSVHANPTTHEDTLTISYNGYKLGDANTDTFVNIVDSAVIGIQIIKSGADTTGQSSNFLNADQKIYADCNSATGDGKITVADILKINQYLVGITPW